MAKPTKRIMAATLHPIKLGANVYSVFDPAKTSARLTISSGTFDGGLNLTIAGNTTAFTTYAIGVLDQPLKGGLIYWETVVNNNLILTAIHDWMVGIICDDPVVPGNNWVSTHTLNSAVAPGLAAEGDIISLGGCDPYGWQWITGAHAQESPLLDPGPIPNIVPAGTVIGHLFDSNSGAYSTRLNGGTFQTVAIVDVSGTREWKAVIAIKDNFSLPNGSFTMLTGNTNFYFPIPAGARAGIYTNTRIPQTILVASDELTLAGVPYLPRIDASADVVITREGSCWVQGGQSEGDRGQLVLNINDGTGPGSIDDWTSYVWRDTIVEMKSVIPDLAGGYVISDWATAIVDDFSNDQKTLTLALTDQLTSLDRAIQTNLYPLTSSNLQIISTPKPFIIGTPEFVGGIATTTDDVTFEYDVADNFGGTAWGAVTIVDLYDKGSLFVVGVDYTVTATGFTLVNKPDGKVFGHAFQANGGTTVYDTIYNLLVYRAGLTAGTDFDTSRSIGGLGQFNFDPAETDNKLPFDYEISDYVTQPVTYLQKMQDIMNCVCGYVFTARSGKISFGRYELPKAFPDLVLTDLEIIGTPKHSQDTAQSLTTAMSGARNFTVCSPTDLVSTISDALKAELTSDYLITRSATTDLSTSGLGSQIVQAAAANSFKTLLKQEQAIQTEINRVVNMWLSPAGLWTLTAELEPAVADSIEVGQTIQVVFPRFSLRNGVNMLVKKVTSYFFSKKIDLVLWCPNEVQQNELSPFETSELTRGPYTIAEMETNDILISYTVTGGSIPYAPVTVVSGTLPNGMSARMFGSRITVGGTPWPGTVGTYQCVLLVADSASNGALIPITLAVTADVTHTSIASEDGASILDETGTFIIQD